MSKKITAVLASVFIIAILFAGCSSAQFKNIMSLEINTYDPATEMAADMLGKNISEENIKNGDFTYCLLSNALTPIIFILLPNVTFVSSVQYIAAKFPTASSVSGKTSSVIFDS